MIIGVIIIGLVLGLAFIIVPFLISDGIFDRRK